MGFVRIFWKNNVQEAYLPKMNISGQIVSEIVAQLRLENSIQTLLNICEVDPQKFGRVLYGVWGTILETICPEMLFFGEYASWTLFFQNVLINPIISEISFLWRHTFVLYSLEEQSVLGRDEDKSFEFLTDKYYSDFLDVAMLRFLLSAEKISVWFFFRMKRPVVCWILNIPFYRRANLPSSHIPVSRSLLFERVWFPLLIPMATRTSDPKLSPSTMWQNLI